MKLRRKIIVIAILVSFLILAFSNKDSILQPNVQNVIAAPPATLGQKWNYTISGTSVSGTPTLFDLYEDGTMEIIYGTSDQGVICLDDQGDLNWSYYYNRVVGHSPAVVDVDGDNKPNVVVGISDRLRFLDYDGSFMRSTSTGYVIGAPTIVDFESDGEWEFLVPSQTFSDGVYCVNSNGTVRWS